MTDLRKAAEMALDWFEGCQVNGIDDTHEAAVAAAEALRQALTQPEQEPVAWLIQYKNRHDIVWGSAPGLRNNNQILGMEPLYTAPPKRDWVELTDEERSYYLQSAANVGWWQAALFVEARLKKKNGA